MHDAPAPPCLLTVIAWRLSGLTLREVWWRHLALGGMSSGTALADYLSAGAAWPAAAHNVLAQTLNEALWELRFPSLAPYRNPGDSPCHVPPRAGPGRREGA